jgi:hypothetical protein
VVQLSPRGRRQPALFFERAGTVLPLTPAVLMRHEYHYRQAFWPELPRDRYPPERVPRGSQFVEDLATQHLPGLVSWTQALLTRLAGQPQYRHYKVELVPAPEGGQGEAELVPGQWESAALLLTDYPARSGDYTYGLTRRRQDAALDPVMDFLSNVRQGPCERYASALALMLRSQVIPARVAELFYRMRFGGRPLSAEEGREVEAELDCLAAALRRRREPG